MHLIDLPTPLPLEINQRFSYDKTLIRAYLLEQHLAIIGGAAFAREVFWYAKRVGVEYVCFVDELATEDSIEVGGARQPVVRDLTHFKKNEKLRNFKKFVVGIGGPEIKRRAVTRALDAGLEPAPPLICDTQIYDPSCKIGLGSTIAPGCIITTNVEIGRFVVANLACTIAHDVRIEDFVTLSPGCHLSGNVVLGTGAFLGSGAVIKEKMKVAENARVGAQTFVVKDIDEPGCTVIGVPGRKIPTMKGEE
jgi:sugar O-acyltransferase (sialic acid O-acetyltransferase NeuD family)